MLRIFFDWIDNLFDWLSDINLGSANVPTHGVPSCLA